MENPLIISDTHFWHSNIIKYEPQARGHFKNAEEMNEYMIERWNAKVSEEDTIFHLGDFIFGGIHKAEEILQRLNGKKILVKGNHDAHCKKESFVKYWDKIVNTWEGKIGNKYVIMSHCPFECWKYQEDGSINLYGHVHSLLNNNLSDNEQGVGREFRKVKYVPNRYNVGADVNNLEPCTLDEIISNNKIWAKKVWGIQ
jgi:calcineurin-like phosphoesterase family protein